MKIQTVIENDVLDISSRLKEVDLSYFVVFNHERNVFEVHSNQQVRESYCFTIPFEKLDERTIFYARKTHVSRKDELIKELDMQNKKNEEEKIKQTINNLKEVIE